MNARSPLGYTPRLAPQGGSPRRRSDLPLGWIIGLGTLVAILVLLFIIGSTSTNQVEADETTNDLVASVRPALTRAGYGDVGVTAEGATVILTGELQTRADVVAANAVAASIGAVARVDNRLTYIGEPQLGEILTEDGPGPVTGGVTTSDEILAQARLSGIAARDPIRFGTGSTEIAPESATTIAQIAEVLLELPGITVEIGGHTDSDGDPEANTVLSQARADAVSAALIAQGVSPDRLLAIGYGADEPVASNETQEGKARNRRIEFLIVLV